MTREYPPGFSPEEIEQRANRNPNQLVKMLGDFYDKIKKYECRIDEIIKHLKNLCEDWKPEYYQDYLKNIYELCDICTQVECLTEFGKTLRNWHSF